MKLIDLDGHVYILFPTIDRTKEQKVEKGEYYNYLFDRCWMNPSISFSDFCCLFGSLKCFKYLLLNKCKITKETLKYSITGGNQEIINIIKEKNNKFEDSLETSVDYHRYELTNWLNENYKCKPVSLPKCIWYYNIHAFIYFLEHGHSLDETDENGFTCLHSAFMIGSLPIVQYLIEKGVNIEAKIMKEKHPFILHLHKAIFQLFNILLKQMLILKKKIKTNKIFFNISLENMLILKQ